MFELGESKPEIKSKRPSKSASLVKRQELSDKTSCIPLDVGVWVCRVFLTCRWRWSRSRVPASKLQARRHFVVFGSNKVTKRRNPDIPRTVLSSPIASKGAPDRALPECPVFVLMWKGEPPKGVREPRTPRLAIEKLVDPETKRNYQKQLLECLPDGTVSDINDHWEKISNALLKAGASACGTTQPTSSKHWISDRTVFSGDPATDPTWSPPQLHPAHHSTPGETECPRRPRSLVEEMEDAKNAGTLPLASDSKV
ncbi:hypothetical protein T265_05764 [Opisthorchis viverrini]|uniref:Uncharacterized protein n=1 Tax=Opisthorchis viverrini TaxID=6198 RepID=A0A074ZN57_OPIVI|nr:hypothetical protein T265_05764 [Opisthorchis viverrini]KER27152.1 hypothetical protein T265_05764 [Opisthorchis viverrini]